MQIETYIDSLVSYAMNTGLAEPCDHMVLTNRLLDLIGKDDYIPSDEPQTEDLEEILKGLLDYACAKGLCDDNITARDLYDTRIMGALTPMPREVIRTFNEKYAIDPVAATDWYYQFSCDTDYIRRYRIAKDMRWKYASEYGEMDITINLSKPEKDPKAIAAAKLAPQSSYPKCLLCVENEGYAGRMNHPARENHRIIPIEVCGEDWCLQYSPYVYYNEHCIVFNSKHIPMKIDKSAFRKLLSFVTVFPHYFVGSNADLPIVGGSILSHEHFQGGHYTFAMETAPVEQKVVFAGYEDISAGIVKWPMSVIRLNGNDPERIADLADKILGAWRGYSDESVGVIAHSGGEPHNTITPHRKTQRRSLRAGSGAAVQYHNRRASSGCVPSPRGQAPHQEREHRPDRSHGPCGAAQPSEEGTDRACPGGGCRRGYPCRRSAFQACTLGERTEKTVYLYC